MILGLTGKEPVIKSKFNTFCSLCRTKISKNEDCIALTNGDQEFIIDPVCGINELMKTHLTFYQQECKSKPRNKGHNQPKKEHVAVGGEFCKFCHKLFTTGEVMIKDQRRRFHPECYLRYKRVLQQLKQNIKN